MFEAEEGANPDCYHAVSQEHTVVHSSSRRATSIEGIYVFVLPFGILRLSQHAQRANLHRSTL